MSKILNNIQNLSIKELSSLNYNIKKIITTRTEEFTQILKNNDLEALQLFCEKFPDDYKQINIGDIIANINQNNIKNVNLILYVLNLFSDDENKTKTLEYNYLYNNNIDKTGLFYEGIKNIDNYLLLKENFPSKFKKFIMSKFKDYIIPLLNEEMFNYIIKDNNITINSEFLTSILYKNIEVFSNLFENPKYTSLLDTPDKESLLLRTLHISESLFLKMLTHPLYQNISQEKLIEYANTAFSVKQINILDNLKQNYNIIPNYEEIFSQQENVTALCKGEVTFYNYIINHLNINNEMSKKFFKSLTRNYKSRDGDMVEKMENFINKIYNDSDLLSNFKWKIKITKQSNPDFFNDVPKLITKVSLEHLDKTLKNSIEKTKTLKI